MALDQDPNDTECVCSDLQHDDYSPAYAWFNYITIIVLLPSISTFGVTSNIVNIFIYSRKRMRSSSNTYLLFLACSDFLVILTGLFIFWIDSARSYIPELSRAPYTTVYTLPFGYMAQTCSIYFTVAAAVDCYINVCWKAMSTTYCTVRRAREINTCITICSIIYNSLRFPQFNLRKCLHDGSQEIIIEICPTPLFFAINTIYNVYMYMVLMTLLPFLFLSIINAIIVLQQSSKAQEIKSISQSDSMIFAEPHASRVAVTVSLGHIKTSMMRSPERRKLEENDAAAGSDDTVTMIMVVVLFLCCNTLALIVNVIETFFEPDALLLNFLTDGSNFLVVLNSSINCLIYFTFNKEYREIFLILAQKISHRVLNRCLKCSSDRTIDATPQLIYSQKLLNNSAQPDNNTVPAAAQMLDKNSALQEAKKCSSPVWRPMCPRNGNCNFSPRTYADKVNGPSILTVEQQHLVGVKTNMDQLEILLDDRDDDDDDDGGNNDGDTESDSGWADTASFQGNPLPNSAPGAFQSRRWIAEVQIEHGSEFGSSQPHIYVRPLHRYIQRNVSITTL